MYYYMAGQLFKNFTHEVAVVDSIVKKLTSLLTVKRGKY